MNNFSEEIESVTIVGGGVAGGLTALFLRKFLMGKVAVNVVAPTFIPPMTVGESTNGPFTGFLDSLDLTRDVLLRECDATIKVASEFEGWNAPGVGYKWVHEFQPLENVKGIPLFHYWLKKSRQEEQLPYQRACFVNQDLIDSRRVPFSSAKAAPAFPYGYHVNGTRLGMLLKNRATALGATWFDDQVKNVLLNERREIASIELASGTKIKSDLFIDCTGFSRKLRKAALEAAGTRDHWISYSNTHACDSTVYVTVPHQPGVDIRPTTLGTALSAGWVWDIPLQGFISKGYVYSSRHQGHEEAAEEFRKFAALPDDAKLGSMSWTPGRCEEAWVGNCISIGVSNSFIEPIESLTSATLTHELRTLLLNFPNKSQNQRSRRAYNEAIAKQCEDNRDFISLHYATATRNDSQFWRDMKTVKRADRVHQLLSDFAVQAPRVLDGIYSIKAIYGMFSARGITPQEDLPLLRFVDWASAQSKFDKISIDRQALEQNFMTHRAYISDAVAQGN